MFSTLEKEIAHFNSIGNVITCGDFYARTGSCQDGIVKSIRDNEFITLPNDYQIDNLQKRLLLDTKTNRYKKRFLDLLLSTDLRILNGRILGNLSGSFTCFEWIGCSQTDYFLAMKDIFPLFNYLKDEQKTEYFYHCLVSCGLNLYRILEPPNSSIY